jgi:mycothiol system anti-sigma-R factor
MSERTESKKSTGPHGAGEQREVGGQPAAGGVCGEAASGPVDCGSALRELYRYLDGEITVERRESIRVHIEECGPCLEAFDFEADLRQLVARTCRCEAPDTLRARVAQALRDCQDGAGDQDPS